MNIDFHSHCKLSKKAALDMDMHAEMLEEAKAHGCKRSHAPNILIRKTLTKSMIHLTNDLSIGIIITMRMELKFFPAWKSISEKRDTFC